MINGHGDDLHLYPDVGANFSSNVYADTDNHALIEHLGRMLTSSLGSYPEPEPYELQGMLAQAHGLDAEEVLVTNGATEAIYLIAQHYKGQCSRILQPTFSEYADACLLHEHHLSDEGADVLWLCSPNNPTGRCEAEHQLEQEIIQGRSPIVIDRSYEYFCARSLPKRVIRPDLLYIHSLTKRYKIPGLRLGYIIGHRETLAQVRQLRQPWSVNALAIEAGKWIASNGFPESIDRQRLWRERDRLAGALREIQGIELEETDTHFMLLKTPYPAAELKEYLAREHGLLVRNASNFLGLSPQHLRIATQTPEMNDALIRGFKAYIEQQHTPPRHV